MFKRDHLDYHTKTKMLRDMLPAYSTIYIRCIPLLPSPLGKLGIHTLQVTFAWDLWDRPVCPNPWLLIQPIHEVRLQGVWGGRGFRILFIRVCFPPTCHQCKPQSSAQPTRHAVWLARCNSKTAKPGVFFKAQLLADGHICLDSWRFVSNFYILYSFTLQQVVLHCFTSQKSAWGIKIY